MACVQLYRSFVSAVPKPIFVDSAATGNGLICEKGGPVLSMALRAAWMLVKVELSAKFWPKTQSFLMKSMLKGTDHTRYTGTGSEGQHGARLAPRPRQRVCLHM